MIISDKLYTPQSYLELVTDNIYIISGDNDVEFIENILQNRGECLWNYCLSDIEHIVQEKLDVVLVDCMVYNEEKSEYEHLYRWFEVPKENEE